MWELKKLNFFTTSIYKWCLLFFITKIILNIILVWYTSVIWWRHLPAASCNFFSAGVHEWECQPYLAERSPFPMRQFPLESSEKKKYPKKKKKELHMGVPGSEKWHYPFASLT
jgi:fucose 4-O-acetylase-like acetyltransferase